MSDVVIYQGFKYFVHFYREKYGYHAISDSFISAMNQKLDNDFFSKTGIRISKTKGKIHYDFIHRDVIDYSLEGNIGTFKGDLLVYGLVVGCFFKWQSKDMKILRPYDEIDEENIEFWFDILDAELAIKEWRAHPPKLGFKPNPLSYLLNVDHFNEHFYLLISFKENNEDVGKSTLQMLNQMLNDWNEASLAKNRRLGIVHNWKDEKITSNNLKFYIDYGSASEKLLKQILEALNDIEGINEVTITSYPNEE